MTTMTLIKKRAQILIATEDGSGYNLIVLGEMARACKVPTALLDDAVRKAIEIGRGDLGEHLAKRGASKGCIDELFQWCIEDGSRYGTSVARLLDRNLTTEEIKRLIDSIWRYAHANKYNQVGIGILFPEIAVLPGVSLEVRERLAQACAAEGCIIAASNIMNIDAGCPIALP